MSNLKIKDVPYDAVAEFRRRKGLVVPEQFMTGWAFSIYINNKKDIDTLERELKHET